MEAPGGGKEITFLVPDVSGNQTRNNPMKTMKTRRPSIPAVLAVGILAPMPFLAAGAEDVAVRTAMLSGAAVPQDFELCLDEKGGAMPVEVSVTGFSAEVKLPRMKVWRFGHWETSDDGKKFFREEGTVAPPPGDTMWLVFSGNASASDADDAPAEGEPSDEPAEAPAGDDAEDATAELPWSIQAINVDPSLLGEGGVAVLNLAPGEVEMEVNDDTKKLEAGDIELFQPKADSGVRYNVKFYVMQNGRRRPFVTTNWFFGEGRRRLAAVVQPEGRMVPKLLVIDEIDSR